MKTKAKKPFLNMDERNKQVAFRVITVMYLITILALQASILYRQFALKQDMGDFEDLNIILTFNSLFLISALLYFGAIPIQKLKVKTILLAYGLMVVVGSLFTWFKYNVVQGAGLSYRELLDKILIVFAIIGLLLGFFVLFSLLGKRKLEKQLED